MRASCARAAGIAAVPFLAACGPSATSELAAPAERTLTLLHLADLHSHLFPERLTLGALDARRGLGVAGQTVSVGGAARLATVLAQERAGSERVLVLDAGDVLEGSATYPLFGGVPELRTLTLLGVDAQALGNHDLAVGASELSALRAEWAPIPLLAANLEREHPGLVEPAVVFDREGLTVAVVGLGRTPDGAVDVGESAAAVQRVIDDVRDRVDVVVALSHLGRDEELALVPRTTGLDVVLGGHTHDVLDPPAAALDCDDVLARTRGCSPRGVPVFHSGAFGRFVGRIDLEVSPKANRGQGSLGRPDTQLVRSAFELIPVGEWVPEHPEAADVLRPYQRWLARAGFDVPIAHAPEVVSRRQPARGDSGLGNFVAHAARVATGADLAILASSGFRADVPQGAVTRGDWSRILPFEDPLVAIELTGAALRKVFDSAAAASCQRGTAQFALDGGVAALGCDAGSPPDVRVGGGRIEEQGAYRVVTTSFLTEPGRWFSAIREASLPVDPARTLLDAVLFLLPQERPCGPAGLPCIDSGPGGDALVDGRITW